MECSLRDKGHPVLYLICMFVVLTAVSCASQVKTVKKPPLQRYSTLLCESVDQFDNIGRPLNPREAFNSENSQIVAYVRFDNLSGEHNLSWDWYTPHGKLYRSSKNVPVRIPRDKFCRTVTAWHALDVKMDGVFLFPGHWTVQFKINDEVVDKKVFSFQNM